MPIIVHSAATVVLPPAATPVAGGRDALNVIGRRMLDSLPPYYSRDEATLAYLDALSRELFRVEALLVNLQLGAFVLHATDTDRILGIWESLLGLPVEPASSTLVTRQVLARASKRRQINTTPLWEQALTDAIGGPFEHVEQPAKKVTLLFASEAVQGAAIRRYAERVTPAHLRIVSGPDLPGFIIGVSNIGEVAL